MRVAIGGISHETNSFSTGALGTTQLGAFSRGNALGAGPVLGPAVIETNVGVRSGIGGYIDTAPEIGAELVPLLFGSAAPSGTISDETYEYMRDELVSRLRDSMPVDAVALCLHGAGAAESYPDIEGDTGRAIREVVGPDVPIVSTWDLHGNISKECAATFDFMCCYHTYPHIDGYERAQEAMRLLPRLVTGWRPATFLEHVPTLLPLTMCCTMEEVGGPAYDLLLYCQEMEKKPGVVDCTVFHGFPYADIEIVGTSVYVATEDSPELAEDIAKQVGAWIWQNRERFSLNVAGATDAVEEAVAASKAPGVDKPIVINETADNTGCGAPVRNRERERAPCSTV
jgi:microcystin degradation protein MlrC